MPKPKTAPDLTPKPYHLLKTDIAAKLSARAAGGITYVLLADASPTTDTPELHLAVTANEGGGLWSKEAVALTTLEAVLDAYAGTPFPTQALRGAMVGRSSNNPPFCLAVLKDLGLVAPAPDKAHQHVKAGDWGAFRAEWLAKISEAGEPVIYPEPKPDITDTTDITDATKVTPAPASSAPGEAEPAAPATPKGKKRKKDAEHVHRTGADVTEADATEADVTGADSPPCPTDLTSDEADRAPTAHA